MIASGEPGTFSMPVCDESGNTVFGIVLVDSGDYSETGGYGAPSQTALRFLRTVPQWFGEGVESIVFQHMPLPQYYRVLKPVPRTTDRSVEGYRNYSGSYFVLDDAKTERGGYLGEGVSCPDLDSGEFDILRDSHAYFAVAAGHDHRNAFAGEYAGVQMIATPTCGFDSYGPIPERRAARLFEFDERHPFSPRAAAAVRRVGGQAELEEGVCVWHEQRVEAEKRGREPAAQAEHGEQIVAFRGQLAVQSLSAEVLRFWCDTCRFGVTMARWPRFAKRWNSNIVMVMGLWVPSHQSGLRHTKTM